MSRISAIIVTYGGNAEMAERCVASLRDQSRPPDQIIISDNSDDGRFAARFSRDPQLVVIRNSHNGGFTGGTWAGAQVASGDLLFFVNPDARPDKPCLALLQAALEGNRWAAIAGAQILLPDGTVNAGDNPIHFSGLSWCGRYRQEPEHGPARDVLAVCGCAYLVHADAFRQFHGFRSRFEMYYEDTDLCWRMRTAGLRTLFVPGATVIHDYEDKGPYRWLWVERNRLLMLLSNTERRTLLALLPGLAFVELGSWMIAIKGKWWRYKLRAYCQVAGASGWLLRERRTLRARREISDSEIIPRVTFELDTPGRDKPWQLRLVNIAFRAYGAWVRTVVSERRHAESTTRT